MKRGDLWVGDAWTYVGFDTKIDMARKLLEFVKNF